MAVISWKMDTVERVLRCPLKEKERREWRRGAKMTEMEGKKKGERRDGEKEIREREREGGRVRVRWRGEVESSKRRKDKRIEVGRG